MGFDELQPLSQAGVDTLGGLGATIIDALDTLWMLGLKDEFGRARDWVASKLGYDRWLVPPSAAAWAARNATCVAVLASQAPWLSAWRRLGSCGSGRRQELGRLRGWAVQVPAPSPAAAKAPGSVFCMGRAAWV